MFRILYSIRYITLVAVICSFLSALLMFYMGAAKTFRAFLIVLTEYEPGKVTPESHKQADVIMGYLIQSLDAFLFALVLLIFSYGVYNLFIQKIQDQKHMIDWIRISNVSHLKHILSEVIIVILFVKFLDVALLNINTLSLEVLILPASILLLSLSLKFLELRH
jgi:uncharacterized membrane protein YqhA